MEVEIKAYSMYVSYIGSFSDYTKRDFVDMALEVIERKGLDKDKDCLDETIRVPSEDADGTADYIEVEDNANHECRVIWREIGRTYTDEEIDEEAKLEAADRWYDSRSDR